MDGVRARIAWSVTLPVLVVGELAGHSLAYRLAAPDPTVRAALLERTGHSYLSALHPVLGLCLALLAAAFGGRVAAAWRGKARRAAPSWWFALLPVLAFLLQEYLERLVHTGHVVWSTSTEPAVVIGLALQIPCGLFAVWLVRMLLRLAHSAGRALAAAGGARPRLLPLLLAAPGRQVFAPRLAALARGAAERGPPLFA
jgi:hypothetical protein